MKLSWYTFMHNIIINGNGAVNRGDKQTNLIILNFAKAFDNVSHMRSLHKLND